MTLLEEHERGETLPLQIISVDCGSLGYTIG